MSVDGNSGLPEIPDLYQNFFLTYTQTKTLVLGSWYWFYAFARCSKVTEVLTFVLTKRFCLLFTRQREIKLC
jgi:hypothetical protein